MEMVNKNGRVIWPCRCALRLFISDIILINFLCYVFLFLTEELKNCVVIYIMAGKFIPHFGVPLKA